MSKKQQKCYSSLCNISSNRRNGGLAEGRIVEIQGPPSAGKSSLSYELVKSTQKMGGLVAYGSMNGHSAITWIHVRSITEISWINVRTINEFSQTPNTWSNHSPVV